MANKILPGAQCSRELGGGLATGALLGATEQSVWNFTGGQDMTEEGGEGEEVP